jgi:hypothetical protein
VDFHPCDAGAPQQSDDARHMSNTSEIAASPRLRAVFAVAAAIMPSLWAWSLVPPIEGWGDPNDDGFSYVGVFYATIISCRSSLTCSLVRLPRTGNISGVPALRFLLLQE